MSLRLLSIRLYLAIDRAWRFLNRVVFFWRAGRGAEAFLERYRADGIFAVMEGERSQATDFEKCLVCSLCTFSCDMIARGEAPSAFEPKQIVSFFGKYSHDSEVYLDEWYPCTRCSACTVVCPNEVPVHGMVEQILARRTRLGFRRGTERERT